MIILRVILVLFRALFRGRAPLALENLALHQQLSVLKRSIKLQKTKTRTRAGSI